MKAKQINKLLNGVIENFCGSITKDNVRDIIRNNSYITGGCIPSMLMDEYVNDYDIYLIQKEDIEPVLNYFKNLESYGPIDDLGNPRKYGVKLITENSINLNDKIQIIIKFCDDPINVINGFDFAHIKSYYICKSNELVIEQNTYKLCMEKELVYTGSEYPLSTLLRVKKYLKKGWTISNPTLIHIALDIVAKFGRFNEQDMFDICDHAVAEADRNPDYSSEDVFDNYMGEIDSEDVKIIDRKLFIEQLNGIDPLTIQARLLAEKREFLTIDEIIDLITE